MYSPGEPPAVLPGRPTSRSARGSRTASRRRWQCPRETAGAAADIFCDKLLPGKELKRMFARPGCGYASLARSRGARKGKYGGGGREEGKRGTNHSESQPGTHSPSGKSPSSLPPFAAFCPWPQLRSRTAKLPLSATGNNGLNRFRMHGLPAGMNSRPTETFQISSDWPPRPPRALGRM
jgi:hypothetical protein